MTEIRKRLTYGAVAILCTVGIAGCSTPKNVTYFQDATPEAIITASQAQPFKAKPGDKIIIIVKTRDAAVSALFNNPAFAVRNNESTAAAGHINKYEPGVSTSNSIAAYTVDNKGDIDFPVLGAIHVGGMSRAEIAGFIKGEIMGRELAKDPTVTVEFINSGVSVLGEVLTPGRIDFNKDYMTVTDALALAGDIKITGLRDNVKVLRNIDGKVHTYIVDLTDASKTVSSPAYYLQQDDVIYVEPNNVTKRETIANGNSATNISFWVSLASLLTTVATTIGVFIKK